MKTRLCSVRVFSFCSVYECLSLSVSCGMLLISCLL